MFNPYEILGIEESASKQRIIQAYKEKSVLHHPDKGGSSDMMKLINQARDELLEHIDDAEFVETSIADLDEILRTKIFELIDYAQDRMTKRYRELHSSLLSKIKTETIQQVPVHSCFKEFKTDLYFDVTFEDGEVSIVEYKDLFDFIEEKQPPSKEKEFSELSIPLTPPNAVRIFINFVSGTCVGNNLIKAKLLFTEALQQTSKLHPVYNLYSGILEILSIDSFTQGQESNLLESINKIIDYARHDPKETIPYIAVLLQDKYFRALFSQALHLFWKQHSCEFKVTDIMTFNNLAMTKSYLGVLAKKLLTKIKDHTEDPDLLNATAYIKKLHDFEQFASEGIEELHTANFYRERGFDTLNWLTVLMPFASRSIIVNILMQAGSYFQQASCCPQDNLAIKIADEKLALHAYMEAIVLSGRSSPNLEIYTHINCLKFMAAFKYQDEDTKELVEAIQTRTLLLADLFPVYVKLQANIDFIKNQDQTLWLIRRLLYILMEIIERNKTATSKIVIDHDYVNVLYQAYEACIKTWYQENYNPELENKFRLELMQLLLERNGWTYKDLDWHLISHSMIPIDVDGWMDLTKKPLRVAAFGAANQFASLEGIDINHKTGEISFKLSPDQQRLINSNSTLTLNDLNEMLGFNISVANFSLDPVDPQMMYHPFNIMRFAPKSIYNTQFLSTMLLSDYILKFLTTGQEVQSKYPYSMCHIKETIEELPSHLKKIVFDFHEAKKYNAGSIHRFWIEVEQVTEASKEDLDDSYKIAISDVKMVVKKHTMERDHNGNLVDTQKDHEGWDLYIFTNLQKLDFDRTHAVINGPAMIFVEFWRKVFFIEKQKIYKEIYLPIKHMEQLAQLATYPMDPNNIVIVTIDNSMFIYNMIKDLTTWAKQPTHFSPEYVFAQEFTVHYDEFSQYILEFARLKELSKITVAIRLLNIYKCSTEQKIKHFQKLLDSLPSWAPKEQTQKMIADSKKLLEAFKAIGLGTEEDIQVELDQECLWVPASVRHHIEGNSSQFVYGGVRVAPRINSIDKTNQNFSRMMGNAFAGQHITTVNAAALSTARNFQNMAAANSNVFMRSQASNNFSRSGFSNQQATSTMAPTSTTARSFQTTSASTSAPVRFQAGSSSSGATSSSVRAPATTYTSSGSAPVRFQAGSSVGATSSNVGRGSSYSQQSIFSSSARAPATTYTSSGSAPVRFQASSNSSSGNGGFTRSSGSNGNSNLSGSGGNRGVLGGSGPGRTGSSNTGGGSGSANFNNALMLKTEYAFQQAGILDQSGKLTPKALEYINDRKNLKIEGVNLKNTEVIARLTKDGSSLNDWGKYTTGKTTLSTGNMAEIHFYYNNKTGEVVRYIDFKVKGGYASPFYYDPKSGKYVLTNGDRRVHNGSDVTIFTDTDNLVREPVDQPDPCHRNQL